MIMRNDLIGEWTLENFEIEKNNSEKNQWRQKYHGILIYTSNGYMSVSINSDVDANQSSIEDRYRNILFYAGTYEIDNNKIIHHAINASDINRIGKDMIREARLENGKLKLIAKGDYEVVTLTWKKINNYELKNGCN